MSGRLTNYSVSASRRDPDGKCLENTTCWLQGHYPIRKVLQHIHATTFIADAAVKKSLDDIYQAVNSNLSFHQQLEFTLPVIPFLLEYKIGLDAGVDLGAVWKELRERLGKSSG